MKNGRFNTVLLVVSIILVIAWLTSIRMRENLDGNEAKAIKYVLEASPEKFINPFIVYGMAKELTDDEEKLAKIIPLVKSGDRNALVAYLETL